MYIILYNTSFLAVYNNRGPFFIKIHFSSHNLGMGTTPLILSCCDHQDDMKHVKITRKILETMISRQSAKVWCINHIYPIASMYGIFTYIYHSFPLKTTIHVGKNIPVPWNGYLFHSLDEMILWVVPLPRMQSSPPARNDTLPETNVAPGDFRKY